MKTVCKFVVPLLRLICDWHCWIYFKAEDYARAATVKNVAATA